MRKSRVAKRRQATRRRRPLAEPLEPRRLLATLSGMAFHDLNQDGLFEPPAGDTPAAGEVVFIDLNNDGKLADTAVTIEPDDFVDTAILNNRHPQVILRGADSSNRPAFDVTSVVDTDLHSTGDQVFANSNVGFWNNNFRFRVDFFAPARSVAIDFIGGSNFSTETGQLDIYDADDALLDSYTTSALSLAEVETMLLERPEGDIAYAVAYVPSGQGNFGRLDQLRFNHTGITAEPSTVTNAQGEYSLTIPATGTFSVAKLLDSGTIQTTPTTNQVESRLLRIKDRTEHVHDPVRNILYIGTESGRIERYDTHREQFLTPFDVGGSISAMDLDPAGDFLYVGEANVGPETGLLRRVDLEDGSKTNLPFPISDPQGGVKDLVVLDNNKLLFSITFQGSSNVPLLEMDLLTGNVVERMASVEQHTLVNRSADRSLVFLQGSNSHPNTVRSYDPSTASEIASMSVANVIGGYSAVHPDGSQIAFRSFGGLSILDPNLGTIEILPHLDGGGVYSPDGSLLYIADSADDEIRAYETTNFQEQFRIPIGEEISTFSTFDRRSMTVSADGRFLFINTPDGVRMLPLKARASHVVEISSLADTVTDLDFGCHDLGIDPTEPADISGRKWQDNDADGNFEPADGEVGLAGWEIYADLNKNGQWDEQGVGIGVGQTIEPDDFWTGYVLNRDNPNVVLMATTDTNVPTFKVDVAEDESLASTGTLVFAHAGVRHWSHIRRLRMDFNGSVRSVAIDFTGGNFSTREFGRLDAYDSGGNLIGHYDTRGLLSGQTERMRVRLPDTDIAYAIAYSLDGQGNFGRLDNLWFAGTATDSEPKVATAVDGTYTLADLEPGEHAIGEIPQAGWQQVFPAIAAEGSTLIGISNVTDHVYNPSDDVLYVTTSDGHIERYDAANEVLLAPFNGIGGDLTSIDVSADGTTLYAGEENTAPGIGFVRKITAATGIKTNLSYPISGQQAGVRDLAVAANSTALVSIQFSGSGSVPLFHLDTGSNQFSELFPSVEQHTLISRSADRNTLFLHGSNSHPNTIRLFDPVQGLLASKSVANVIRARSSVSPDGQEIAFRSTSGGLSILDRNLDTVDVLANLSGPVAFDPVQDRLYVADASTDQIVAFDSDSYRELYRINIDEDFTVDTFSARTLGLSDDGETLFLTTNSGIRKFNVRQATAHNVLLVAGQNVGDVDFGNRLIGNVAPVARDDSYQVAEDRTLDQAAPGVLDNDLDANNDSLQPLLVDPPQHGSLDLRADGSFEYSPDPNFDGTDTFTYRAQDGQANSNLATVTITVIPANDAPTGLSLSHASVAENQSAGVVGTVTVADPDSNDTHTLTVDDDRFTIDSGVLKLKSGESLDHEAEPSVTLELTATDSGGEPFTRSFSITVEDVNEFDPVVSDTTFGVAENSAANTLVGSVSASDADSSQTLSYAITGGDPTGAFRIDSAGGQIQVDGPLDHESTASYVLTVTATDNLAPFRSSTGTITIDIGDVNEFDPVVTPVTLHIDENSGQGTLVGVVSATDQDSSQALSLTITDGDPNSAFAINNAGQITVADPSQLNHEFRGQFLLTVTATDNLAPSRSGTATVTVVVDDVNEFDPVVTTAQFSIAENSADGTTVGTVVASDQDSSQTLSFAITGGNTNDAFRIDAASGEISVNHSSELDHEGTSQYQLTVTATDNLAVQRSSSATITVDVTDVNEFDPVFDDASFTVPENTAAQTVIGTLVATDADTSQQLSFAIAGGDPDSVFGIDSAGRLIVLDAAGLNHEATTEFQLTIEATDDLAPLRSTSAVITVTVGDVNEFDPVIDDATFSLDENSPDDQFVGQIPVSDADHSQTHTFEITAGDDSGAFRINDSGELHVSNGGLLNHEATPAYNLTVRVTDSGTPPRTDTANIIIGVDDVNEFPPVVDAATFSVMENAADEAIVDTVTANDADTSQSLVFSIAAGNTDNAFAIDPASGVISVLDGSALNHELQDRYTLTVRATDDLAPTRSGEAPIQIDVIDINDRPQVALPIQDASVLGWTELSLSLDPTTFGDEDGDPLSLTAQLSGGDALPPWLTFDPATATFQGMPANAESGTLSIEVTASDPDLLTASDTFELEVVNNDVPFQNRENRLDTNGKDGVSPVDVLVVFNYINQNGSGPLGEPDSAPTLFYDASGDNAVTPVDGLAVIIFLNEGDSEGESGNPVAAPPAAAIDALLLDPLLLDSADPAPDRFADRVDSVVELLASPVPAPTPLVSAPQLRPRVAERDLVFASELPQDWWEQFLSMRQVEKLLK